MATTEEQIAFRINLIGSTEGAKSLSDLKAEFKALQKILSETKEGTENYQKALQKLGKVKDDIGDLRDTIGALNPEGKVAAFAKVGSTIASGFAAAQGAAALFGAESEELQKTMMKVQAAMALAEGIKGITAAGDAFKILNVVMRANPILAVVAGFAALAAVAYTVYENFTRQASAAADLEKEHAKLVESTAQLNKEYELQIKNLSGLKSTEEERLKLSEKQIERNILIAKSSLQIALAKQAQEEAESSLEETIVRATGNTIAADKIREDRVKQSRKATEQAIFDLKAQFVELNAFHNVQEQKKLDVTEAANKKSVESHKKSLEEKKIADQKAFDELFARLQQEAQIEADIEKFKNDEAKAAKEKKLKDDQEFMDAFVQSEVDGQIKQVEADKWAEEQKRAEREKTFNTTVNGTREAVQKTQQIFDLYFQWQLKQNKGNAQAERDIRKKQFNVNKAFGVAGSIIDGVGAIQKALNNPYPLNIILAVLTGVLATANTIKIATAKFDDSGGASSGDTGSLGTTASAPVIPQPNNTVTQIRDDGKVTPKAQGPQKVYVLETDIKNSNDRVANIEETAKIG